MQHTRQKLAKMLSKEKAVTAKSAMRRPVDLPLSTEMIDWMDSTINDRDEAGFGSEAVTSILAQPLDSESLYCPVSSIINSKLSAPRVPSPVRKDKLLTSNSFSGTISDDISGSGAGAMITTSDFSKSQQLVVRKEDSGDSVKEAVDRMNVLWLQRKAAFEREEGDLQASIKTLDEALDVHLGTSDYSKANLGDRVISSSGTALFDAIQEKYFLYDKSAHRIATKLQNFYHRHHSKRGRLADLISSTFRRYLAQRNYRRYRLLRHDCARLIQFRFKLHLIKMHNYATKIQTWWRLLKYITDFKHRLRIYRTARILQKNWRGFKGRVRAYFKAIELYMVKKIQRVARGYIYRRDRGFYIMLYHKLFYRAALRIQSLCRRLQAIRKSKNQLLFEISREQGRIIREKAMIAETVQIEIRRTRMYLQTAAGKLHFKDTLEQIHARDKYYLHIEPQLTLSEKLAQQALIAFELFDVDGSGYIDERKLSLLLSELCIPMDRGALHVLFLEMDKFNMGEIDFNEFLDWYCITNSAIDESNITAQKEAEDAAAKEREEGEEAPAVFGDAIVASAQIPSRSTPGQAGTGRLSRLVNRSIECLLVLKKYVSKASGSTMHLRAEREILRQSTQWLTRDSISSFRLSCAPKFQCCQCLKPFVLFTDYFMHFDQRSGFCQVVEQKALFYQQYWLKHHWGKQRQCEYEVVSANNEYPKVEHFKVMAIYNELALVTHLEYARILNKYVGVAQRMYMHVLNPSWDEQQHAGRQKRLEDKQNAEMEEVNTSSLLGRLSGSMRNFRRKKADADPPSPTKVPTVPAVGEGEPDADAVPVPEQETTPPPEAAPGSPDGNAPSSAAAEDPKSVTADVKAGAEALGSANKDHKKHKDHHKDPKDRLKVTKAEDMDQPEAVVVVPLPPTMREVILQVTDVDIVKDRVMPSSHVVRTISQHLRCRTPIGWVASGQYLVPEVLEWLVDEVDERVALDRPIWVLTKRGKLKRDALVLAKIHVYCSRIYQVAMEEALVVLLNNRIHRPRRMTIPDAELVEVGLPSLTRRAYCDYNLSIVAKLDRVNQEMYKMYVPKPKHLMQPLMRDENQSFRSLFSKQSLQSMSAFTSACGAFVRKVGLITKNSAIMSKRLFTLIFGNYKTFASIGIMGAGTDVSEEVIKDYVLAEYHARAHAKLSNRFVTSTGKAQLKRLSNELWASHRLIRDKYSYVDSHTGKNLNPDANHGTEREGADNMFSATFMSELLSYAEASKAPQFRSGGGAWDLCKGVLTQLFYFLFHKKTTLQDALANVAELRYVYGLIASEFGAAHRAGVDKVDYELLEGRLNFHLSEAKKLSLEPILDPNGTGRMEFTRIAKWLYDRDDGVQHNFLPYISCFSPSALVFSTLHSILLFVTSSTYRHDAKAKLVNNQRILSRLEGDLRRHLLKSMHDDEYILNMGVYVPEKKKRGAQWKERPKSAAQKTVKFEELTPEPEPEREPRSDLDAVVEAGAEADHSNIGYGGASSGASTGRDGTEGSGSAAPGEKGENGDVSTPIPATDSKEIFDAAVSPPAEAETDEKPTTPEVTIGPSDPDSAAETKMEPDLSTPPADATGLEETNTDPVGPEVAIPDAPAEPEVEEVYSPGQVAAADSDDFLMKTQIDQMKEDDEQGELRVLYRQAEDKAERDFVWDVMTGRRTQQVLLESQMIRWSYDMMRTYSMCISPRAAKPRTAPTYLRLWRWVKRRWTRVRKLCDYRVVYVRPQDNYEHEVGWDLTMAVLVYTFDTDCTGNFDEGEIRLLLECCSRSLSEKEILYHFPQVLRSAANTEWITDYLSPRVAWKIPGRFSARLNPLPVAWRSDRGMVTVQTRNVYSTAMKSLISLHRQIALEQAKAATTLALTGKLLAEEGDEKDNGCLVTRCQLLAMRQVTLFMVTLFGRFHQVIIQEDDVDPWWRTCVETTSFSKRGLVTYACKLHSEKGTRVLVTEIPYIIRYLCERFGAQRSADMTEVGEMVALAVKYTHKLVFLSMEKIVRMLEPVILDLPKRSFVGQKLWQHRRSSAKLRERDALLRIQSMARCQAIQIAFNFPNLYVPHTNYRCLILGLVQMIAKKPSLDRHAKKKAERQAIIDAKEREKELYETGRRTADTEDSRPGNANIDSAVVLMDDNAQPVVHTVNHSALSSPYTSAALDEHIILRETGMLYLLSMGYVLKDLRHPQSRRVIVAEHPNGAFSKETIDKDRVAFWGRKNEVVHLSILQRLDRWRRFFMYSIYYWRQYNLFQKTLLENKEEADVIAATFLKELLTGVSSAANVD